MDCSKNPQLFGETVFLKNEDCYASFPEGKLVYNKGGDMFFNGRKIPDNIIPEDVRKFISQAQGWALRFIY